MPSICRWRLVGTRLHRRRWRALRRLEPLAAAWQERLSGGRDQLRLKYRSGTVLEGEDAEAPWREAMAAQLQLQRSEEVRLGQCLVGPQRDEIALLLGEQPARRYGSAGQQRTLVLALKLAELALVEEVVGAPPLLLLDDVLAELDPAAPAPAAGGGGRGPPVPRQRHPRGRLRRGLAAGRPAGAHCAAAAWGLKRTAGRIQALIGATGAGLRHFLHQPTIWGVWWACLSGFNEPEPALPPPQPGMDWCSLPPPPPPCRA